MVELIPPLIMYYDKYMRPVAEPAYDTDKDIIRAVCEGDGAECSKKLHEVSASTCKKQKKADLNDSAIEQISNHQFVKKMVASPSIRIWKLSRQMNEMMAEANGFTPDKDGYYWRRTKDSKAFCFKEGDSMDKFNEHNKRIIDDAKNSKPIKPADLKGTAIKTITSTNWKETRPLVDAWNNFPAAERDRVSEIEISDDGNGINYYVFGREALVFTHGPQAEDLSPEERMRHEYSHFDFASWSRPKQRNWIAGADAEPPLTPYVEHVRVNQAKFQRAAEMLAQAHIDIRNATKKGIKLEDISAYQGLREKYDEWGITQKDVDSGRLQDMTTNYYNQMYHIYANEQYAALMTLEHGIKTDHDPAVYTRLKRLFERVNS